MTGRTGAAWADAIMDIEPGDILRLRAEDRLYTHEPVTLRVTRVRHELMACYDGEWVWIHGYAVDDDGRDGTVTRVLARVAALPVRKAS